MNILELFLGITYVWLICTFEKKIVKKQKGLFSLTHRGGGSDLGENVLKTCLKSDRFVSFDANLV